MTPLVCDCSVTAAWCLQDETSAAADSLLHSGDESSFLVPAIWPAEMANVLWAAERRDRISAADAEAALTALHRLPLRIDTPTPDTSRVLLGVARARDLSAYDAAYLELAMRVGAPLATFDRQLRGAAEAAGVRLAL